MSKKQYGSGLRRKFINETNFNKVFYIKSRFCEKCSTFDQVMDKVNQQLQLKYGRSVVEIVQFDSQIGVERRNYSVLLDVLEVNKIKVKTTPTLVKVNPNGEIISKLEGIKNEREVIEFYNYSNNINNE